MNIAVFGSTGRTGHILLGEALDAGHTVTVLVRDPSRVGIQRPALNTLTGSVQDSVAVGQAIHGADAVVSVLGPSQNKPVYEISAATVNILSAMQASGVRRFIMTAGAGVHDPGDAPGFFDRLMGVLVQLMAGHVYEDMRRSVDAVRATTLDWTIVRVPMLTDAARSGKIRVGYVGRGTGPRLSRHDLADFLLRQLTDKTYIRQALVVSN
jgi:putative NADH-flavin reductase